MICGYHIIYLKYLKKQYPCLIHSVFVFFRPLESFWIGLSDVQQEGSWIWMNSGTVLTYQSFTNWEHGKPDNYQDNENCACIDSARNYLWDDWPCQTGKHYICEKADE